MSKKEKILLNVNCGPGTEILCKTTSHPLRVQIIVEPRCEVHLSIKEHWLILCMLDLQELKRQAGMLGFSYEVDVLRWSSFDFVFTYTVSLIWFLLLLYAVKWHTMSILITNKMFIFRGVTSNAIFSPDFVQSNLWWCSFAISIIIWCWSKGYILLLSLSW